MQYTTAACCVCVFVCVVIQIFMETTKKKLIESEKEVRTEWRSKKKSVNKNI